MTTRARAGLATGALTVTLLTLSCFSERQETTGPLEGECRIALGGDVIGATAAVVAIRDFTFFPDTLRVTRGTRVVWLNCEPPEIDAHTSTSDTGIWSSPFLSTGQTFARTFEQSGSFDYFCVPHPFMRGVVIVE
ncbi:MAG: plastocyanin/azurin family copper-binding protein [Longimicrobiales bacterium]